MKDANTVGDILQVNKNDFNPMTIDTSEVKELSKLIPKNGSIDVNSAEILATKFLRGADMCSELMALATAHVIKADTEKKRAYSYAALVKANEKSLKTDKMRSWYADIDEDYIKACNKSAELQAFMKWISGKYEAFIRAHYLSKKILERAYPHEKISNFNGILDNGMEKNDEDKTEDGW